MRFKNLKNFSYIFLLNVWYPPLSITLNSRVTCLIWQNIIILSVIKQYLVAFKRQRLPGKLHLDGCEVPTRGQAGLWGSVLIEMHPVGFMGRGSYVASLIMGHKITELFIIRLIPPERPETICSIFY